MSDNLATVAMNCRCSCPSKQAVHTHAPAGFASTQSRAQFSGRPSVLVQRPAGKAHRQSRPAVVEVLDFKFMKKLGLKKPEFLPDFGKVHVIAKAPGSKSLHNTQCCRYLLTCAQM